MLVKMNRLILFCVVVFASAVCTYGSDAPCLRAGGRCQHDSLTCSGNYRTGLCSGGVRRRCCVPSSSNSGSFSTGMVSQQCLKCICNVESGCRPIGCHWDVNSDSCGYFQIKRAYWIDCGSPGGDWKACANNLDCSSQCVQAYMARYHHYSGCSNSCQSFARIHNGGPRGCRHSNTAGYWRRVQAQGCN
uniref:lysozyme n=1 Tax=Crassostrea virginica TaxID=6565 RepID=A0A8B8BVC1_CRAVI|nr:lysozyme 1-like [Crassostrea virginica]